VKKISHKYLTEIVYCVSKAGSELFQSRATCSTRAALPKTEIAFPNEPHMLFFVTTLHSSTTAKVMQGSMQKLFGFICFKRHAWRYKIYPINVRCNQKFMFCKNRGIDFSVWLCRGYARDMYAQHFWGFPFYRPALLWISTLPPGIIRASYFTGHRTEKERFPTLQPLLKTKHSVQAWPKIVLCLDNC